MDARLSINARTLPKFSGLDGTWNVLAWRPAVLPLAPQGHRQRTAEPAPPPVPHARPSARRAPTPRQLLRRRAGAVAARAYPDQAHRDGPVTPGTTCVVAP